MGRPAKTGVDYFSHDADASDKKTLTILTKHFGNDGYAAWFRLLEQLARSEGHFYDCQNAENFEYLEAKLHLDGVSATEILDKLSEIDAIDADLWSKKIIWCGKFVDRLSEVYRKRGREVPVKPSFCDRKYRSDDVSVTESTQSKVKESIVEYRPPLTPPGGKISKEIIEHIKSFGIDSDKFTPIWLEWKTNKAGSKYKTLIGEKKGITHLMNLSNKDLNKAQAIVDNSLANNYQGLVPLTKSVQTKQHRLLEQGEYPDNIDRYQTGKDL